MSSYLAIDDLVELRTAERTYGSAPDWAVCDGALGFWTAIEESFPGTKHQRCWVHKTANVLNKVALSVQVNFRTNLGAIFVSLELSRSTWLITPLAHPDDKEAEGKFKDISAAIKTSSTTRRSDGDSMRVRSMPAELSGRRSGLSRLRRRSGLCLARNAGWLC